MKAGILYSAKEIAVGEAADPRIRSNEVLVNSQYAGICGTDLHIYRGEFAARVAYPAIQGHEFGGVVEEVGADVQGIKVGDRVAVDPVLSCHGCIACQTGHLNACRSLKLLGVDINGGYGQYVAAPATHVYHLPDSLPLAHAPMVEMYGLGHHILQRGRVQPGETVVILGAGKLGLSILDVLCHSVNPGLAIVTDRNPFRLNVAQKLGAAYAINVADHDPVDEVMAITQGQGADCVIEAVGHYHLTPGQVPPVAQAVQMIRSGGRVVTAGLGDQETSVHFKTLVLKEAEIIASRVTLGEFPRAIRMMGKGLLHPDLLITHQMPMRDITDAFATVDQDDPETIKIVLDVMDA
ncbi:MAG: alcohol dehydrogenase catalytic domain-containing protein [Anaerolineae bacterium]|nr:alcohol dehydrogenase catalytic domain-containing protein [Anaerolineae bacterium]